MKRNKRKRKGRFTMLMGLLMIAAALLLTVHNLSEQQLADASSGIVLTKLSAQIPTPQPETTAQPALVLTDESGSLVSWPMDERGAPIPWPVEQGMPAQDVTDAAGQVYTWESEAQDWAEDASGNLLPWIKDEEGQTIAWPTDIAGEALGWDEIQQKWQDIVLSLLPYQQYAAEQDEEPLFVSHPDIEMPTEEIDGHLYIGVLEIPKLELSLPVMSEWSLSKFKIAPCRYVGSVYTGDIVIAAHNYDRHFGRIKTLEAGDEVRFTDVEGNVFIYTVSGHETLGKTDVAQMEEGDWDMTLFTCTPGGAKRVTVRLKQKSYIWQHGAAEDE